MSIGIHSSAQVSSSSKKLEQPCRNKMLACFVLTLACLWAFGCRPKNTAVERSTEDGIEVVINHLEPYHIPGRPTALTLQEIGAIDTENDAVARAGVTDFYLFDVDSQGNIYVMVPPTHPGNIVFKLSPEGTSLLSFGPMGQGPFELEYPSGLHVDKTDRVWLLESPKRKYHVFDAQGKPLFEVTPELGFEDLTSLDSGSFLIMRMKRGDPKTKYWDLTIGITGFDLRFRHELDDFAHFPNKMLMDRIPDKYVCGTNYVFLAKAAGGSIFAGNSDHGYEILVCDFEGHPLRKIRKDYIRVPVSPEFKKKTMAYWAQINSDYASRVYFPDNWHPFQSFVADEQGRLLVMTYETGKAPGEYMCDVFDPDGVFVARTSVNSLPAIRGNWLAAWRGDRLYVVQDKPNGFRRLAIYRLIWS